MTRGQRKKRKTSTMIPTQRLGDSRKGGKNGAIETGQSKKWNDLGIDFKGAGPKSYLIFEEGQRGGTRRGARNSIDGELLVRKKTS